MKLRFLASLLFLAPALLPGQEKGIDPVIRPGVIYAQVKQYLNLTEAQLESLQRVVDSRNQATQIIYNQISQKYEALNQLLSSGGGTAAQLGQLLIDIRNLQKQLPLNDGPYKAQALNLLTADQRNKLPRLSEALQLQTTASQAGWLLLIDTPQPDSRTPVVFGMGSTGSAEAPVNVVAAPGPAVAAPLPLRLPPMDR